MSTEEHRQAKTDSRLIDGIASVTLRVCDLDASIDFYRDVVGLDVTDRTADRAELGSPGGPTILELDSAGVVDPADPEAPGLFHVAIRVPSRSALGDVLARLSDAGLPIGSSDHLVSEALYVDDPDGHGVEIYRDRPADEWPAPDGQNLVPMPTENLDLSSIFQAGGGPDAIGAPCPPGTDIGHVHLQVSDLDASSAFFGESLGLDQTMQITNSARFFSSNAYHHHFGINTWSSEDQPPAADDRAGIERVVVAASGRDELESLRERLERDGRPVGAEGDDAVVTSDPDETELRFVAP